MTERQFSAQFGNAALQGDDGHAARERAGGRFAKRTHVFQAFEVHADCPHARVFEERVD